MDEKQLNGKDIPLLDNLAANRTFLANERTFLSFLRTALTMFIAGATFIKFFDSAILTWIGWAFIPVAVFTAVAGAVTYHRMKCRILKLEGIIENCPGIMRTLLPWLR
ncbi:MAG: DUF202 domain-containing protein [candidate division Zixibacteria bacterium]|nr:DUF202 domain-containing protein [candidate division Zixibacteria bacterium]